MVHLYLQAFFPINTLFYLMYLIDFLAYIFWLQKREFHQFSNNIEVISTYSSDTGATQ